MTSAYITRDIGTCISRIGMACGVIVYMASGMAACSSQGGTVEKVKGASPMTAPTAPATNSGAIVPAAPTGSVAPAAPTAAPAGPAAIPDPPYSKDALLAAAALCASERFQDFQGKAASLKTAADAWAAAPADAATTEGVRAAWKTAMASWQEAELFRIGPAAAMFAGGAMSPGAKNARNEIYAFPQRNTCVIDTHVANEEYKTFATIAYDARGLGAIEYLAFNVGTMHTCTGTAATAIMPAWTAAAAMLSARRAQYTVAVAGDLVTRSGQLVNDWAAMTAAFSAGTAPYTSQQAAVQALSDALFYVDKELKDFKLGRPLMLSADCMMATAGVTCGADAIESRIAGVSTDNIRQNLKAFRRLFEGCGAGGAGLGIDALLKASNLADLAGRIQVALNEAQAAADAAPALEGAITSDPAALMALHAKIKVLTDLLKTEFLSTLELMPPPPMTPPPSTTPAGGNGGGSAGRPATPTAGASGPPTPVFPGGFDGD